MTFTGHFLEEAWSSQGDKVRASEKKNLDRRYQGMEAQLHLKLALDEDGFSGAFPMVLLGILMTSSDVCIPVFCSGEHSPAPLLATLTGR